MSKPQKEKLKVLYSDERIVIIDKLAGISANDICKELKSTQGKLVHIFQVDIQESGIEVFAKSKEIAEQLEGKLKQGNVRIVYLAIVKGVPLEDDGRTEVKITRDRKDAQAMVITDKRGVKTVTKWKVLADFGGAALIEASPLTNRKHQVRLALASEGLVVAQDELYGGGESLYLSEFKANYKLSKGKSEQPLIERPAIHCYQVDIKGWNDGKNLAVTAKPENKFKAALKMLGKHNPDGPAAFGDPELYDKLLAGKPL